MAIEAWGGHSDWGRDAYAVTALPFPIRNKNSAGPFVFQAKFVEAANAKGAKPRRSLLGAVEAEAKRIHSRKTDGIWENPKWYVLLTNCPLNSTTRAAIAEIMKPVVSGAEVITLGGKDICSMLDAQPELRRSFPEIMSLRDLDVLLQDVVNHSIIERSKSAIEEAREIVAAFVQTANYHKAFQILKKHNFVVLDGPPEMGKTAIARVFSLAQLSLGWEALDCRTPDDLLHTYRSAHRQLFIVDDAFGRTEYEPTLGRLWEKDLSRVFHKIDQKHWLIWTTRKHILARALKDMDLVGKGSSFPEPGELVVTADDLTIEEKAKILYRHAKAGNLNTLFRSIVRIYARDIVVDDHFTPERIRRFVNERIPELMVETHSKKFTAQELKDEIIEAIRNPTKRMQKAFRKLPSSHEWILVSLLDCDSFPSSKDLRSRYRKHRTDISEQAFDSALEDLVGTFVKFSTLGSREYVDWIHPSYRDLVIDELMTDYDKQTTFLQNASSVGLGLALSEAGGAAGKRVLPFLGNNNSWRALELRALELINLKNPRDIDRLLRLLSNACTSESINPQSRQKSRTILHQILLAVSRVYEDPHDAFSIDLLRVYLSARSQFDVAIPVPNLELVWARATDRLRETLDEEDFVISEYAVDEWSKLARIIEIYVPTFFQDSTRISEYNEDRKRLAGAIEDELDMIERPDDEDEVEQTVSRLRSLAGSFEELNYDEVIGADDLTRLASRLESRASRYEEQDDDDDNDKPDEINEPIKSNAFDVAAFFADL